MNINLNREMHQNSSLNNKIVELNAKLEKVDLQHVNKDKEHELKIRELNLQHEETIKFLEEKLEAERDRCSKELIQNKLQAEDEIDKQRTEYEKYLIDIRYYNEQNKLKLLDKISKLQTELDSHKNLDSSYQSLKDTISGNPDTEKFINTITGLNEKLTMAKLQFQDEKQHILKEKEELEKKLSLTREKVRKLTKKNKDYIDKINVLTVTAKANVLKRCNTEKGPYEVNELRVSVNSLKSGMQKHENTINELRQSLRIVQTE